MAMASPRTVNGDSTTGKASGDKAKLQRLTRIRPWIQTAFLGVWLAPLGRWLHGFPACVFHCYACPLSAFACPVGLAANYAAVFSTWTAVPWLLIGVLLLVGGAVGSLVCGWACPFGFLQDLLARIQNWKWTPPNWLGNGRFLVLIGLVLLLPWYLGRQGILFTDQSVSICRLCPAGALEAGLWYSVSSFMSGAGWIMSWYKLVVLVAFVGAAIVVHRPWCRIFCPLGGLLALFNRVSLFHLRFHPENCIKCNLCRSRCSVGVKVDERVNTAGCVRCLECTTCGAIRPAVALPGKARAPATSKA
jgi:ferredoxin-type protein NapH